jgi:maltooligosyltrehalose synthase
VTELRATYRVQLRPDFGFDDAAAIADYLADLGVSHLYSSPCLQAAPGSTHGYDVVAPTRVNEGLGGADGHRKAERVAGQTRENYGKARRVVGQTLERVGKKIKS